MGHTAAWRLLAALAAISVAAIDGAVHNASTLSDVMAVDLSPLMTASSTSEARAAVVSAWDAALSGPGFARITGHGVDASAIEALFDEASAFFSSPLEAKLEHKLGDGYGAFGAYTPAGVESVGRTEDGSEEAPPDLVVGRGMRIPGSIHTHITDPPGTPLPRTPAVAVRARSALHRTAIAAPPKPTRRTMSTSRPSRTTAPVAFTTRRGRTGRPWHGWCACCMRSRRARWASNLTSSIRSTIRHHPLRCAWPTTLR